MSRECLGRHTCRARGRTSALRAWLAGFAVLLLAMSDAPNARESGADPHSYSNFADVRVRHLDLTLDVSFEARRLEGHVDLLVERLREGTRELVLDTSALQIRSVERLAAPTPAAQARGGAASAERRADSLPAPVDGSVRGTPLRFSLAAADRVLGRALVIELPAGAAGTRERIRITYRTSPEAHGLQWLEPRQTADRSHPFLFSQSQSIYARSWIPLQDSPSVRATYRAAIRVPAGLRAVMSADNTRAAEDEGRLWRVEMPQPIPSYLMAIAVGRLDSREIGPRTTVYAEPSMLDAAVREFAETPAMIHACEAMYGPYRWGRYDLLILPPAFPYGGMENPRLSFITPTLLAGDRSLVSLIAHELAHSWSGNLVTNATWRDFWMNEGFTTYLEREIIERLYGEKRREMESVLGLQSLREDLERIPARFQPLAPQLRGEDPEDAFSQIPYEKGRLFLDWLAARFDRESVRQLLREWFDANAFQSVTTEQFRAFLVARLLARKPGAVTEAQIDEWLHRPGLPQFAVLPRTALFERVDERRAEWLAGRTSAQELAALGWSVQETLHFLGGFEAPLPSQRLAKLDAAFGFTTLRNAEIAHAWLLLAIRGNFAPAWSRLEEYLLTIGRRKLVRPLYDELMKTASGADRARRIYATARAGYHPILVATLDPIVKPAADKPANPR